MTQVPVDLSRLSLGELIGELEGLGVRLWAEDGQLRFRAPMGVMTDELRAALRSRRPELLAHLADAGQPRLVHEPATRYEPFPVTDVQSAYLLGRGRTFAYGGVACHGYGELRYDVLDPARMRAAWRSLIARHDMLRAVIEIDGAQRVLPEVPPFEVPVVDLRGRDAAEVAEGLRQTRSELDHRVYTPNVWPLFDARVTLTDEVVIQHVSIDFLVADFISIQVVLGELHHLYHRPDEPLPPLSVTFRDYLRTERAARSAKQYERDRAYWLDRLDTLPPAPELPIVPQATEAPPRFVRHETFVDAPLWTKLRESAGRYGVSPSGAVLAAFAETIAAWSSRSTFTLDITLLNRLPLHEQVPALVGDFTAVELLAVDADPTKDFAARARDLQAQLWQDLDHRTFTGIEVIREITRREGAEAALFPVVFTSAIGLASAEVVDAPMGELGYGISQTPQVWIDCQNIERAGGLATNWDVREGVFPPGLTGEMFDAFADLLRRLATDDCAWGGIPLGLPPAQSAVRETVNATGAPVPAGLLHEGVVAQALRTPDRVAIVAADRAMTYAELLGRANALAQRLEADGCRPGDLVAVVLDRGWAQAVAVLGVLLAGGAYVPVDTYQPTARRARILENAGVRFVVTDSAHTGEVGGIAVDLLPLLPPKALPARVSATDLAYVIHTSGSTGAPKGVMISHEGALNTIADINARFDVGPDDVVLGLSNLGFDLSVYDIFGPLAEGGCLVVPDPGRRGDPSHWAELVGRHGVTMWNSVPAQLQMLSDYLTTVDGVQLPTLRLAMLSGDWIPVTLPDQIRGRLPRLRLVSLGGATEASIWSIWYPIAEVPADWRSIPYGWPLVNQTFHVLDAALRPRPDWVPGELYIGGTGVALGYLNDPQRTAERFVTHPVTGERLYRTGDLGRYLPDGCIEFLGRQDHQVKIRGYRIELAEVESALASYPAIAQAVVVAAGDKPLDRRLVAFVEPGRRAVTPGGAEVDRELADQLAASAVGVAEATLAGVDRESYLGYAHALDAVALPTMVLALRDSGLFAGPDDAHQLDEILRTAKVAPRQHRLVRRWLRALVSEGLLAQDGSGYRLARPIDAEVVRRQWTELADRATAEEAELLAYFRTSADALPALLRGDDDPLALLFPEGKLDVSQNLYEQALFNQWANTALAATVGGIAAGHLGRLRVLEVGVGAGGTTEAVLCALSEVDVDYLCTDLSPFFLGQAKARFPERPGLRFGVLDLDQDYRPQGLAPNSFDVVIAGDVLHATSDVDGTLRRLRELLAPGGWLVAHEMTRDHYQIMTSIELLIRLDASGDFTDERRGTDSVFLSRDAWRGALERAGADCVRVLAHEFVAELGVAVFAGRFKADRVGIDLDDLAAHLAERLPDYMVPASTQVVDALPLNANDKLDRKALLGWVPARGGGPGGTATVHSAPANDLERQLAAIWADVLGVDDVDRLANLFQIGGDSLIAAQITGRVLEEVPAAAGQFFDQLLRQLLEQPTVAALAASLASGVEPVLEETAVAPVSEDAGLVVWHAGEPLTVFVHSGELTVFAGLVEAYDGPLGGVAVPAGADPVALAVRAARAIVAAGHGEVTIAGYGASATLALEAARALTEMRVRVDRLLLVCPERGGEAPTLYAGDITLFAPPGTADGDFWADLCLGDVTEVDVPGPVLDAPRVTELATALRGAR